jgi:adenine-specific DNA-methyltransferase
MKEHISTETLNLESPSDYSDRLAIQYAKFVSLKHKKENGQFFTPSSVANLMASYCDYDEKTVTVLDPGFGLGILTCALIENLIAKCNQIRNISVTAYETDSNLIFYSELVLNYLKLWLNKKNISFEYKLCSNDFILHNLTIIKNNDYEKFDVIISNPPYFKLGKMDERALASKGFISGESNIYSLFMSLSVKLLKNNGKFISITPRSFASGKYFRGFRDSFFNSVQIDNIHLFKSRRDTFNRDKVLQETVIIKATKTNILLDKRISLTSSKGVKDITENKIKNYFTKDLINLESAEKILYLPSNNCEISVLQLVNSWTNRLSNHDIQISTGPVVYFRNLDHIRYESKKQTDDIAPLFWLQNVEKMSLNWPKILKEKGQYIIVNKGSQASLLQNKNYILLRRFSTKDDKSRLIAAPYFSNFIETQYIGVENRVNYIYRKDGHLEENEVSGLCGLLNSELFDTYFQIFNGNVNVSATELREMKFPSLFQIKEIGNKIIESNDYSIYNINTIVNEFFKLENIFQK